MPDSCIALFSAHRRRSELWESRASSRFERSWPRASAASCAPFTSFPRVLATSCLTAARARACKPKAVSAAFNDAVTLSAPCSALPDRPSDARRSSSTSMACSRILPAKTWSLALPATSACSLAKLALASCMAALTALRLDSTVCSPAATWLEASACTSVSASISPTDVCASARTRSKVARSSAHHSFWSLRGRPRARRSSSKLWIFGLCTGGSGTSVESSSASPAGGTVGTCSSAGPGGPPKTSRRSSSALAAACSEPCWRKLGTSRGGRATGGEGPAARGVPSCSRAVMAAAMGATVFVRAAA
mmetsp:Transcript_105534/g.330682  ORF Transcript_105534/g.330682 Transcript_105534/m.330682 type:complete len:305 (+) Transcript_105534:403-1317(+)